MGLRRLVLFASALGAMCAASLPSFAAERTTNVEEAVQAALAWHPTIATAKAKLEEQVQRKRVAKSGYFPQMSAGVKSGYEGRRDEQKYSQALTLSVSQMLYDFGKVRADVAAEDALIARQQAELLKAIEDTLNNTSTAAYEIWRNQQLEAAALAQHQALSELTELVSERHQKGAATRSDVVQSQTRVEAAQTQILQFQKQKMLWQNRLASLLNQRQPLGIYQAPQLAVSHYCHADEAELVASPTMVMATAMQENAKAISQKANARTLPTISLDPSATHYIKSPNWSNQDAPHRTEYGVFLNVNLPLYQGGALNAERKLATATQMAAASELMSERQRILEVLFTSLSQQQVLAHHAEVLKQREALSKETRRLYQQQYLELGVRPLIDLLNAEQEIYQTQFEQINTQIDEQLMGLACAHELGRLHQVFALGGTQVQGVELAP